MSESFLWTVTRNLLVRVERNEQFITILTIYHVTYKRGLEGQKDLWFNWSSPFSKTKQTFSPMSDDPGQKSVYFPGVTSWSSDSKCPVAYGPSSARPMFLFSELSFDSCMSGWKSISVSCLSLLFLREQTPYLESLSLPFPLTSSPDPWSPTIYFHLNVKLLLQKEHSKTKLFSFFFFFSWSKALWISILPFLNRMAIINP